jgi:hypothetical protein
MKVKNDIRSMVIGTCYQGKITCTYNELADLGLLTDLGSTDKSTCDFVGMVGGQVVTVYDYYNSKALDKDAPYTFNVGGINKYSVIFLEDALYKRYGKSFPHNYTYSGGNK